MLNWDEPCVWTCGAALVRTDPLRMGWRRTGGEAPLLCAFLSTLEVNWKRRLSSSSLNRRPSGGNILSGRAASDDGLWNEQCQEENCAQTPNPTCHWEGSGRTVGPEDRRLARVGLPRVSRYHGGFTSAPATTWCRPFTTTGLHCDGHF